MTGDEETGIDQEGTDLLTQGMGAGDNPVDGSDAGQETPDTQDSKTERPAWMEQLTGDLKENESLTKFKNFSDLGNSYVELERKLGNSVVIPGEDASDEDRAAYNEKMGIPKSAEEYTLTALDGVPEHLTKALAGSEESLRKRLLDAGASQKTAESIYGWMQEELKIGQDALEAYQNQQLENADKVLRDEWKGDYEKNLTLMTNGLRRFATDDFVKEVRASGIGNHPEFCKVFLKIGQSISEDSYVDGGDGEGIEIDPDNFVLDL